ncbi:MAG TPA: hypothetical protein VMW58_05405 [Anaerolineae bacterium]|nr:hypothetical protein [Anaerolineae bacterium]
MTDRERILAFLRSVSPRGATNSEIPEGTGIEGRYQVYQVYQLTQELMGEGRIHGVKRDRQATDPIELADARSQWHLREGA